MRIHVSDILDGDQLSHDIFNNYGLHVLSKGTRLYKSEISRLLQHQIDYVDVSDRNSAPAFGLAEPAQNRTLESTVNPKWLPKVQPIYENAVKRFEQLFDSAFEQGVVNDEEVTEILQPLLNNLQLERDVVSMLLLLNTEDDYTYQHSVQVGMLSYYLATWLGYSTEEAAVIGKAGFLHDIGKSKISGDILNKPGKLTSDEFEEVKRHTLYGHDIILNSFREDTLAIAALQHHERIDGSGYPHGLKGEEIHPVSRIIAVVDIYSAMISARVYQKERDLLYVLKELHRLSFNELDPVTTHTFIKHMIPNFIGKKVRLSNEQFGMIVMTHPTEFFKPLVQIDDQFVDLTIDRHYEIEHVYL
ncbi:HD-GYP domain-containing protein [Paenibacillus sp. LHD-117]|uniref:HD-GYP domain-containing protein n=1 Tax=Paenibacillus sp. LHD-117 TaxID=3071412 RepID=UPI0027E15C1C|nr:HD-GYP domain-containing protein [Paenibacillus sp. LHD-117]MDQ6418316.1 HD-GYP domain-containing protein [Paenibacillus sp. LHD-117]